MDLAKIGDIVTIDYTLKFTNGHIYDSTEGKTPIRFELGKGLFISGFEKGIHGMYIGEIKTFTIKNNEAFGPKNDTFVKTIPIDMVPKHIRKEVGQRIEIKPDGYPEIQATITHVTSKDVTIDTNPIQAGKDLVATIHLHDIYIME